MRHKGKNLRLKIKVKTIRASGLKGQECGSKAGRETKALKEIKNNKKRSAFCFFYYDYA